MIEKQLSFQYGDFSIEFELAKNSNLLVNATQMMEAYPNKNMGNFIRNDGTKKFIECALLNANSHLINVKTREDLIISTKKGGTWMHRVLALKFAAWLSPEFELWVFNTIDDILFGKYKDFEKSLQESAKRKKEIAAIEAELKKDERFQKLAQLKKEEDKAKRARTKKNKTQLDLFIDQLDDEE